MPATNKKVLEFAYELETHECPHCFMVYAAPGRFIAERRKDHQSFYCPAGHSSHYPQQSGEEKLRAELDKKKQELEWERGRVGSLSKEKTQLEKQLRTAQTKERLAKRRLAEGKCVMCHENFPDLKEHIKQAHPDFETPSAA